MPRPRKGASAAPAEMRAATESGYVDRPVYVPAPITLVITTKTEITDGMVGLVPDSIAQARAVEYFKASLAYRARLAAALKWPVISAVEVPLRADALEIFETSDPMNGDLAEALGRLVNRPRARFLAGSR